MKPTLTLITALLLAPLAALPAADAPPPANWDRVPLNIHFGKRSGNMSDAEIEFLAKHSVLVTLEKGHGDSAHGSTEAGVADTARRLRWVQRLPAGDGRGWRRHLAILHAAVGLMRAADLSDDNLATDPKVTHARHH